MCVFVCWCIYMCASVSIQFLEFLLGLWFFACMYVCMCVGFRVCHSILFVSGFCSVFFPILNWCTHKSKSHAFQATQFSIFCLQTQSNGFMVSMSTIVLYRIVLFLRQPTTHTDTTFKCTSAPFSSHSKKTFDSYRFFVFLLLLCYFYFNWCCAYNTRFVNVRYSTIAFKSLIVECCWKVWLNDFNGMIMFFQVVFFSFTLVIVFKNPNKWLELAWNATQRI